MKIETLKNITNSQSDLKLNEAHSQFETLLKELEKKKLPESTISLINNCVNEINSTEIKGTQLIKLIRKQQKELLKQVEKIHKIVPKNYCQSFWLLIGMTAFGLPIGLIIGLSLNNIGLLGLGLPIGIGIGVIIGVIMDKKALNEGRQLNLEIKN